jgi:hypothetical protein
MSTDWNRRTFLKSMTAFAAAGLAPGRAWGQTPLNLHPGPRKKQAGLVRGAFFYPPAQVVLDGKTEDNWAKHEWFTWPGNQFKPEEQQALFTTRVNEICSPLDLNLVLDPVAIYTDAGILAFIAEIAASKPEALILFNFWNSFSKKIESILDAFDGPIILYHPVGANHQLPPERFRTEPRMQYIHGIENWEAIARGLRAIHAKVRMRQSRLLRVSGKLEQEADEHEAFFDMPVHSVPAGFFNDRFDAMAELPELQELAESVRRGAQSVTDLHESALIDAARSHATVLQMLDEFDADAITIECLFLKHRKPCLSFSINNGLLVPCGCENDLNASLTLMLGANLFGRGGFQHNPEYDTEENRYFASHCTCLTRLNGPQGPEAPYAIRPFFHQMPKTAALDVVWPEGERVTLCKYNSADQRLDAWVGDLVSSPSCPPTGGCATRALVKLDGVDDVCSTYSGPHPVLYCGDFGRQIRTFAKLYPLELRTNAS